MKIAPAILSLSLVISLAGCVLKGKPKVATPPAPAPVVAAPAPPPPPAVLSMPQTQVQLPPEQPVDPEALTPATPPAGPPSEAPPPRASRPRRAPAAPATTVAEPPATPPATTEPERGPVQEMLSDAEKTRLKNNADTQTRALRAWLNSSRGRHFLNRNDPTAARIQALVKASDEAAEKGDMREASDLADRAVVFMRELQSGR